MATSSQTAIELRKEREKIEKRISEIEDKLAASEFIKGTSSIANRARRDLENELNREKEKLRKIIREQGASTITPIQDATVTSTEVKDPNEPDKGRDLILEQDGVVIQTDPTVKLSSGETREAMKRDGFMIGVPISDAKDAGAYILKPSTSYPQEIYNKYSKDPQGTIEMKRRLIEAGVLDRSEPLDASVGQSFRDAMTKIAAWTSQENYFKFQSGAKGQLMTFEDGVDEYLAKASLTGGATKTYTDVVIPDRAGVEQMLNNTYLTSIGRKATKKEIDEFYRKVQKEAKAKPTVTTQTATGTGGTEVRREGFSSANVQQMASATAETRPDFLAYQLSTNFYNALYAASQLPVRFSEAPTLGSEE